MGCSNTSACLAQGPTFQQAITPLLQQSQNSHSSTQKQLIIKDHRQWSQHFLQSAQQTNSFRIKSTAFMATFCQYFHILSYIESITIYCHWKLNDQYLSILSGFGVHPKGYTKRKLCLVTDDAGGKMGQRVKEMFERGFQVRVSWRKWK